MISLERRELEQRCKDIKRLTRDGFSGREISEILRVSRRTVDRHRGRTALSLSAGFVEEEPEPTTTGRRTGCPTSPDKRYYNELRIKPYDWEAAACRGHDPEMWFPGLRDNEQRKKAKEICKTCPVREKCLQWAFEADERYGIWGAMSSNERYKITKKR